MKTFNLLNTIFCYIIFFINKFAIQMINAMKSYNLLVPFLGISSLVFSQNPDSSFGNNGVVIHSFNGNYTSNHQSSFLQNDQKILNVGYAYQGNYLANILVTRHLNNGVLDATFDNDGVLDFTYGQNYEEANSIMQLSNGKIVIGGATFGNAVIAMLNDDGSFDTNFGTNGKKIITNGQGNGSKIEKILQQPDGKILVFGRASNGNDFDFMVSRLNLDGSFDLTFGNNGIILISISTFHDFATDAAFQSNGKIVIAGHSTGSQDSISLIRLNANGNLDNTFGTNGKFNAFFGSSLNEIKGIAIQSDDKIIVSGRVSGGAFNSIETLTIRFLPNGSLDNSFNNQGYVISDFRNNTQDEINDVLVLSSGNILIFGGSESTTGGSDFAALSYLPNGNIDPNFGINGRYFSSIGSGSNSWINEVIIQPDGKLVLCGLAVPTMGAFGQFALLRLQSLNLSNQIYNQTNKISVFPNPTNGNFTLNADEEFINSQVYIMNLQGQIILKPEFNSINQHFDLSQFPEGIYMLNIKKEDKIFIKKIIKF